jgi:hypothetical protein
MAGMGIKLPQTSILTTEIRHRCFLRNRQRRRERGRSLGKRDESGDVNEEEESSDEKGEETRDEEDDDKPSGDESSTAVGGQTTNVSRFNTYVMN